MTKTEPFLAQWLHEREIDLRLRACSDDASEDDATARDMSPAHTVRDKWDGDPAPAVGQVRLIDFPAQRIADIRLARPALVLGEWEDGRMLLAPFSPYTVPATLGEVLVTNLELWDETTVVACWCATAVTIEEIEKCWWVGDVGPDDLAAAWAVFRHAAVGAPIPAQLLSRVGSPIMVADDPRREYQRELADEMRGRFPLPAPALLAYGATQEERWGGDGV